MTGIEIALISIVLMLVLIYAGMHVSIALVLLYFLSVWTLRGNVDVAGKMLGLSFRDSRASYTFGVVPLFVLMGLLVSASGLGRDTFEVAHQLFRRISGGLGIATVAANAVFAAITGISIASAAIFTKVAVPEMRQRGYTRQFAVGVVAGSSVLGMLIPPSLLFILYGVLAEQSVGALFIAGVVPVLLLAVTFVFGIVLLARFSPGFVGTDNLKCDTHDLMSPGQMLRLISPILLLVVLVLGGIYGGVFTPTEAGAVGALGALLIALIKRRLTAKSFWEVLFQTGHITASICFLIISANLYSRMLALSGLPNWMSGWVIEQGYGPMGVVVALVLVTVLLGTILDSASILLLTLPVALPVLAGMQVDLIWLGVVVVLAVEIGLLTPPFGIAVFIIKSTLGPDSDITLGQIFGGAFPFALMMAAVLALVIVFPTLATGLL